MTYEDTSCPCGGKKPNSTMLCDDCVSHFQGRSEFKDFRNETLPTSWRRHAAIVLLSLAKSRKRVCRRRRVTEAKNTPTIL